MTCVIPFVVAVTFNSTAAVVVDPHETTANTGNAAIETAPNPNNNFFIII